ncbi:MAG: preprotein translocase subunit SecE, partial [Desulfatiglandales bacterium]
PDPPYASIEVSRFRRRVLAVIELGKEQKRRLRLVEKVRAGYTSSTRFLRECKVELKKVKWPTKKELISVTSVVIILVLAFAFFLGLVDLGLIKLIKLVIG